MRGLIIFAILCSSRPFINSWSMLARFLIWTLLVLVPFQSFAAVGLIQCQHSESSVSRTDQEHHEHRLSTVMTPEKAMAPGAAMHNATHPHHSVDNYPNIHSSADTGYHHSHKLPCCGDGAVIFSLSLLPAFKTERFSTASQTEAMRLTSIYLEGPKRPPRHTSI
jgi:hypothetical protein